ncbi:MAG: hypothetical protein IK108_07590 [Clostridia bacterium]|nr:hypothetical protein [Clostridia bacterium]
MPYIAHASVKFEDDFTDRIKKDEWHFIKCVENIEYRWKLCQDRTYIIICGLFDDRFVALWHAKQMYVNLFYSILKAGFKISTFGCESYESIIFVPSIDGDETTFFQNEEFFFRHKTFPNGHLGPGVFEVDKSMDEFSKYDVNGLICELLVNADLSLDNADEYIFLYSRESQKLLHSIALAEKADSYGMKMTVFCSLLEHLSESADKDPDTLLVLDELIENVNNTSLTEEKKQQLRNFLNSGRKMSAKQRCLSLCKKYAKENYGGFSTKSIVDEAYSIRSAFSHGNDCEGKYSACAAQIKLVVLDVVKEYMREREKQDA